MALVDSPTADPRTFFDIDLNNLLERICVRPPYFALRDLHFDGATLCAKAKPELPVGAELLPMSAAEIGRHAAIAGLSCAALHQKDDERRYYLAQEAEYTGYALEAAGEPSFRATLTGLDKRAARAGVEVDVGGVRVAHVEVRYTVLTDAAFTRLFKTQEGRTVTTPGYVGTVEGRLVAEPDALSLRLSEVPLEICAGHFERHPAVPVAVLMSQLSHLAGSFLGGAPYHVVKASIKADNLCWAGADLSFEVKRGERAHTLHAFDCRAVSGGAVKARMDLALKVA